MEVIRVALPNRVRSVWAFIQTYFKTVNIRRTRQVIEKLKKTPCRCIIK